MPNAHLLKKGGSLVGANLDFGKSIIVMQALVVGPANSSFVGLLTGPDVSYIVGKIEGIGYVYMEIPAEIV